MDVGGGSTEINFISNGELIFTKSYNIGTVRSLSGTVEKDTITKLEADLDKLATQYQDINIIGSGGNINKLYKMAEDKDPQKLVFLIELLVLFLYSVPSIFPLFKS